MNRPDPDPGNGSTKLLPHQSAFVETALSPESKRVVLLRGAVGLGKTTAVAALVSRLMREHPDARALLLCPASLQNQWVEILRRGGTQAVLVDRYRFREMLDTGDGIGLWPEGVASVLSEDFAKLPDITESLASIPWDIVVADEAHRLTGTHAELMRRVGATAKRVVLSAQPGVETAATFTMEAPTVVEWRWDQLAGHDGKPLVTMPRPSVNEVRFILTRVEQSLSELVHSFPEALGLATPQTAVLARILLRTLQSSPAALENALRRLAARLEDPNGLNILVESLRDLSDEDESPVAIDSAAAEKIRRFVAQTLEALEATPTDSKLGAFNRLLSQLTKAHEPTRRICAFTEHLGTVYYLAAEMDGQDRPYLLLHGAMTNEARRESIRTFESIGGILIATQAVITEESTTPEVTDLVLYDVPEDNLAVEQIVAWFNTISRTQQLIIHALVQQSDRPDIASLESLQRPYK